MTRKRIFLIGLFLLILSFGRPVSAAFFKVSAGLTPQSAFYFLDRFGEAVQRFFTFSRENKARLQLTLAAERAAEISFLIRQGGVSAEGLATAEDRLATHLAKAALLLEEEHGAHGDASVLAGELRREHSAVKTVLKNTFKELEYGLERREKELSVKAEQAEKDGRTDMVSAFRDELAEIAVMKGAVLAKADKSMKKVEASERRFQKGVGKKDEADIAREEARAALEVAKSFEDFAPKRIAKAERLLAQADELFDRENYEGAKHLARQAEESLAADEIKTETEEEKNLREERLETAKRRADELKKERERIEEEAKQIEELLEDTGL